MLLSIGFTEIAIIVCGCLAAGMVILSIVASAVSRAADKKSKKAEQPQTSDSVAASEERVAPQEEEQPVASSDEKVAPEEETAVTDTFTYSQTPAEEPITQAEAEIATAETAEESANSEEEEVAAVTEEAVKETVVTEEAEAVAVEEPVVIEEPVAAEEAAEAPAEATAEETAAVAESSEVLAAQAPAPFGNIRYSYSFMAKLIQSDEETQARYGEVKDYAKSYNKVRVSVSWRQARISSGRNVLAVAVFKGRKICIAYALDPAQYEGSKYGGQDISEVKRFEKTPYLIRLTSKRKVKYAKELFDAVAEKYGLTQGEIKQTDPTLPYRTTEELIGEGLVKVLHGKSSQTDDGIPEPKPVEKTEAKVEEKPAEKPKRPRNKKAVSDAPKKQNIEKQEKITAAEAAEIADEAAEKVLEKKGSQIVRKEGVKKAIVNVDTLSQNYAAGDSVTIESLVEKGLVPSGTNYVKVLARGLIDKPLHVHADDYSMDAVKMIAATGGVATKHISEE